MTPEKPLNTRKVKVTSEYFPPIIPTQEVPYGYRGGTLHINIEELHDGPNSEDKSPILDSQYGYHRQDTVSHVEIEFDKSDKPTTG